MSTLGEVLDRRSRIHRRIIRGLRDVPREQALSIVLSYVSVIELEKAAPTICGEDDPGEQC